MSHITSIKSRLGDMFLRDRGNIDDLTVQLIRSEVRKCLDEYFIISDCEISFSPLDTGEVALSVKAVGRSIRAPRQ